MMNNTTRTSNPVSSSTAFGTRIRDSILRIGALLQKEVHSYFNSAIAYIVIIFFLSFTAIWLFFIQRFIVRNIADLRPYFAIVPSLFIFLIPAITMRSWAEERKLGTAELLLTLPCRESELVIAKFLGACTLLVTIIILSVPIPLMVNPLGDFEAGQIVGQYIGVMCLGSALIAIGLLISSLSTNQISAFVLTAVTFLTLSLIGQINLLLEPPQPIAAIINWGSLTYHFRGFEIGLIDTRDLFYYLGLMWLGLYLNIKVLIWRKLN